MFTTASQKWPHNINQRDFPALGGLENDATLSIVLDGTMRRNRGAAPVRDRRFRCCYE